MDLRGSNSNTSLNYDSESVTSNGKKRLRESPVQLTSLSSLLSHHRYFFLYNDTLVISKQKGPNTFKLKCKVRLENLWISSSNTSDSFLIGWPLANHLVHFRSCDEKEDWFSLLSLLIAQSLRPVATTISMEIQVEGRKQTIRRRIDNGRKSAEIVVETATELGLPHTSYELRIGVGDTSPKSLQGPENVYTVIMSELDKTGIRLSDSQRCTLDTCPIANIRLFLSNIRGNKGPSPKQLVNSIKKRVLSHREPRGLFGRELDGPTPPQPILTIVDHLRMNYTEIEGIFRKSPKQSTFKELRAELDRGVVPDFNKYSAHVLASMLKDYLRSIPGKLLLSGNYQLWMREVVDEEDLEKKLDCCRNLLFLLPTAHCILLANVLKLLNKISQCESSRMTASSLSVCLGPCMLDSNDMMEGGKKIPLLVEFLISHAAEVVPGFSADNVFAILNAVDVNANVSTQGDLNVDAESSALQIEECDELAESVPILETITEEDCDESPILLPDRPLSAFSTSSEEEMGVASFTNSPEVPAVPRRKMGMERGVSIQSSEVGGVSDVSVASAVEPPVVRKLSAELAQERKKSDGPRSPCLKRIHFQKAQTEVHQKTDPFKFDNFERLKEKLAEAARVQERVEREQRLEREQREQRGRRQREETKEEIYTRQQRETQTVEERKEQKNADTQTSLEMSGMEGVDFHSSQWMSPQQRFPPYRNSQLILDSTPESSPRLSRKTFNNSASNLVHSMINQRFGSRNEDKPTVQVQPFSQTTRVRTDMKKENTEVSRVNRLSQLFSEGSRVQTDRVTEHREGPCIHGRTFPTKEVVREQSVPDSPVYVRRTTPYTPTQPPPPMDDRHTEEVQFRRETNVENQSINARKSCPEMSLSPVMQRKQMWEERCESPLVGRRFSQRSNDVYENKTESPRMSRRLTDSTHQPCPESPLLSRRQFVKESQQEVTKTPTTRPTSTVTGVNREDLYVPMVPKKPERSVDEIRQQTETRQQPEVRKSELQRSLSTRDHPSSPREGIQRAGSVKSERDKEWSRLLCKRGEERFVGLDPIEVNWSVRHLKTLFNDTKAPNIRTEYA